jgi:hypothetical protein
MAESERKDGKTPNGGDYSVAYYLDGSGNPVDKSKAKQMRIIEYTKDGKAIYSTYGELG